MTVRGVGNDFAGRIVRLKETGSTNDDAKRLAREGAPEWTVVVAERQTAGRGRRGRSWITPPGLALTFSVVLRPSIAPKRAPLLVLLAAAAVREAAEEALARTGKDHEPVLVKWPNDVVVGSRKLCGVLVETSAESNRVLWCVVGVGVNVNQREDDFPPRLREQATSFRLLAGQAQDREGLLKRILHGMKTRYDRVLRAGFDELLAETRRWSATVGRRVRVYEANDAHWDGFAVDIGYDGALLVRPDEPADGGVVAVHAAEVSVREASKPAGAPDSATGGPADGPVVPTVV